LFFNGTRLMDFSYGFDHSILWIKPAGKFFFYLVKLHTVGNKHCRIYLFRFYAVQHMFKIFPCCIAATHQRGFALMKFGMAERNFSSLQSYQYESRAMRHVLKSVI